MSDAERDAGPSAEAGPVITPYPDGPLIVRGPVVVTDTEGNVIDPGRSPFALCRCGRSGAKPFCDGTHKKVGFSSSS